MFNRYVLASSYQRIRSKFDMASLPEGEEYIPSYNIAPGNNAYVIIPGLNESAEIHGMSPVIRAYYEERKPSKVIRSFSFGLQGVEKYTVNFIRAEGDRNLSNDPHYTGSKAIFLKPNYKKIIREQRCLVLADAFIVDIDKKPHLVYMKNKKRPFGFAGLWNKTTDADGNESYSFGILTTVANPLIRKLGGDRMPVIVPEYSERRWLSTNNTLSQVLDMLNPYPAHSLNAYPVSERISDPVNNDLSVIQPVGRRLYSERMEPLSRKRVKPVREPMDSPTMEEVARMGKETN
ncbi:SOS response-associated peptidase [Draconibacterium sp. IB214405]|uniref:SOS response-associated peptidase n=1 Tax=Draconibacterium sp. IB214405 TaxID=3097352 RepID=UPI002A0EBB1D|nr:SOS response-associated peptidase [Draconibacterium sp. IB214405]MDX8340557.1 SOS response-associated peptidase [Draconibacterium sp. IB214405]